MTEVGVPERWDGVGEPPWGWQRHYESMQSMDELKLRWARQRLADGRCPICGSPLGERIEVALGVDACTDCATKRKHESVNVAPLLEVIAREVLSRRAQGQGC